MKIFRTMMDVDTTEQIRQMWLDTLEDLKLYEWSPEVVASLEYGFLSVCQELITLNLLYDYDVEEYLYRTNWSAVETAVECLFLGPDEDSVDVLIDSLNSLDADWNPFAIAVLKHLPSYTNSEVSKTELSSAMCKAFAIKLEDVLRMYTLLDTIDRRHTPSNIMGYGKPIDVSVDCRKRRINFYH